VDPYPSPGGGGGPAPWGSPVIRTEVRLDRDRCGGCRALLAGAELRRIITPETVDLLALCARCGQPTWIVLHAEVEG